MSRKEKKIFQNAVWSQKQFVHCTLKILKHVLHLDEACGRRWVDSGFHEVPVNRCGVHSLKQRESTNPL